MKTNISPNALPLLNFIALAKKATLQTNKINGIINKNFKVFILLASYYLSLLSVPSLCLIASNIICPIPDSKCGPK